MSEFTTPTLAQCIEQARNDLSGRMSGVDPYIRRTLIGVCAIVWGGVMFMLYGSLVTLANEMMVDTAQDWLKRHAAIWGITAAAPKYAAGPVTLTGTADAFVPAGTILQRADQVSYIIADETTFTGTSATVQVTCQTVGATGDAIAGTGLSFVSPVSNVSSAAVVAAPGITGGSDEEDKEVLRARVLDRIQKPPRGGADSDYERWVNEVFPAAKVWVYPLWMGAGTVGVAFIHPDRDDVIPTSAEVDQVAAYIEDGRRPVTANVYVFAPIADPIAYQIHLVPATDAVKAAVIAQLKDMLIRDAQPGGTELLSRINEAISLADGETDHALVAPVASVTHSPGHIAVYADPTWV